jgi:hypothetical protein
MVYSSGVHGWSARMDGLLKLRERWYAPIREYEWFAPVGSVDGLPDWRLWIVCSNAWRAVTVCSNGEYGWFAPVGIMDGLLQ